MTSVTLTQGETPPSLNRMGTRGSHWAVTTAKKYWQVTLERLLMASGLPRGQESVEATATLRFAVKRRRDEGNYRWFLEKVLADALVRGGWLSDDTPEHFSFGRVSFDEEKGRACTTIVIQAEDAA